MHWPCKHKRFLEPFNGLWKWGKPRLFCIDKHTNKYLNSAGAALKSMDLAETQYSACIFLQPSIKHLTILSTEICWYLHDKLRSYNKQPNKKSAFPTLWYNIKCKCKSKKPWKSNVLRTWGEENLSHLNQQGLKKKYRECLLTF